jgi:hypothetical protein
MVRYRTRGRRFSLILVGLLGFRTDICILSQLRFALREAGSRIRRAVGSLIVSRLEKLEAGGMSEL